MKQHHHKCTLVTYIRPPSKTAKQENCTPGAVVVCGGYVNHKYVGAFQGGEGSKTQVGRS